MDELPEVARPRPRYRAVIISPHLDDAVFSCGGMIAKFLQEGPVLVLNVFTRYLSDLKIHGAVLGVERHREETDAARFLGFESRNLNELDAPFRRDAYRKLGNLFRPPVQQDMEWLPTLRQTIFDMLAEFDFDRIYIPLGVGWHVDHVLTHLVFESWASHDNLFYYEDAPYCCIPHSTRYRLNDIAIYPRQSTDASLAPTPELCAWWQVAKAYANTALMRNLQPWIMRQVAVPAVGFYLFCLMSEHRSVARTATKSDLEPVLEPIADKFERKVDAMSLYRSQFGEFFSSRQNCASTLAAYAREISQATEPMERYWKVVEMLQKDVNHS